MKKRLFVLFIILSAVFALGMTETAFAADKPSDWRAELFAGASYADAVDEGAANGASYWATPRVVFGSKDINFGAEGSILGYNGKSGTGYEYTGLRASIGPAIEFNPSPGLRITPSLQGGVQLDSGSREKATGSYEAEQTTPIILTTLSLDYSTKAGKYMEAYVGYVADLGGEKSSTWNGGSISSSDDPADDKSRIDATARMYVVRGLPGNINVGVSAKAAYAFDDQAFKKGGGIFASFGPRDSVKIGVEALNVSGSESPENDGWQGGITVSASLHHLGKMLR